MRMSFSGNTEESPAPFSGNTPVPATEVIKNTAFWPDISLHEFRELYRLPQGYAVELMINHLKLGIAWTNDQLSEWKKEQIADGHTSLDSVPEDIQGEAIDEETPALLYYKRAVFCYAKADLLLQFATINRREAAQNEAKEAPETREELLTHADNAVADFLGNGRIDVELI
jgi:hypothetical protein